MQEGSRESVEARWSARDRDGKARSSPNRQPATRPRRSPGRPGFVQVLRVPRRRVDAQVRWREHRRTHEQARHRRRHADRTQHGDEGNSQCTGEGGGVQLRHPETRAGVRRCGQQTTRGDLRSASSDPPGEHEAHHPADGGGRNRKARQRLRREQRPGAVGSGRTLQRRSGDLPASGRGRAQKMGADEQPGPVGPSHRPRSLGLRSEGTGTRRREHAAIGKAGDAESRGRKVAASSYGSGFPEGRDRPEGNSESGSPGGVQAGSARSLSGFAAKHRKRHRSHDLLRDVAAPAGAP